MAMAIYTVIAACLCAVVISVSADAMESKTKRLIRSKAAAAHETDVNDQTEANKHDDKVMKQSVTEGLVRSSKVMPHSSVEVNADGQVQTIDEAAASSNGNEELEEKESHEDDEELVMQLKEEGEQLDRGATTCNVYKRLNCNSGRMWTYNRRRPAGSLKNCQNACKNAGRAYMNYFFLGACMCCNDAEFHANGYPSIGGPVDCVDPAEIAAKTTRSTAEVEKWVGEWADASMIQSYSVLAGDGDGIRFMTSTPVAKRPTGSNLYEAWKVDKAVASYSVGKWLAAASLGACFKKKQAEGVDIHWDKRIADYIPFWDKHDGRSKITFSHLMSHRSGLVLSTAEQTAIGMQLWMKHEDLYFFNYTINLKDRVQRIHDLTPTDISPPAMFAYGETHYLVMQYAIMQATNHDHWRDFFYEYWGKHLGLEKAIIVKYGSFKATENFFEDGYDQSIAYGFWEPYRTGDQDVLAPDAGSQIIISPCGYARFLQEATSQGWQWFGAPTMDKTWSDTWSWKGFFGEYAYGHWVFDDGVYNIWHSAGYAGAIPIVSTLSNGKMFWIYLNIFQEGGVFIAATFIAEAVAIIRELFEPCNPNAPGYTTQHCSTKEPTGHNVYGKEWKPERFPLGTSYNFYKGSGGCDNTR